ncbi:MAG TPA: hypothetical protein VE959_13180 [Bryobacteraceae bacterium]|nr:hypothetical protein [Bryobacteraceae bacterium]
MRPRDTSPEAWAVFIDLHRKMPVSQKLRQTFEYSALLRAFARAGMRERYPNADERELFLRTARQNLGPELFRKVYGDVLPDDTRPARDRC